MLNFVTSDYCSDTLRRSSQQRVTGWQELGRIPARSSKGNIVAGPVLQQNFEILVRKTSLPTKVVILAAREGSECCLFSIRPRLVFRTCIAYYFMLLGAKIRILRTLRVRIHYITSLNKILYDTRVRNFSLTRVIGTFTSGSSCEFTFARKKFIALVLYYFFVTSAHSPPFYAWKVSQVPAQKKWLRWKKMTTFSNNCGRKSLGNSCHYKKKCAQK